MTDSETDSTTADDDAQIVELTRQPIDLYKILKFEGLVGSGGEAKAAIAEGHVTLNGTVETQKRKKIVSGDTLEFGGIIYRMHCDRAMDPPKTNVHASIEHTRSAKLQSEESEKPKRKKPTPKPMPKKAGRKAIGIKS